MGRVLLFTGEKGVGKSTAVQHVIERVGLEHFTGFFTHEVRSEGRRVGFEVVTLDGARGALASTASNSSLRVGREDPGGRRKYGVELEFLEGVAVPALREAIGTNDSRILVIDEIGPMQMLSGAFRQVVGEALTSKSLVLGTVVLRSVPWADDLKARDSVETFLLTRQNRGTAAEMMALYLQQGTQETSRVTDRDHPHQLGRLSR
jgi:nucleoside-triphosphatase